MVLQRDEGKECSHVCELLRAKVSTVREKIRELGLLEEHLTKELRKCHRNLGGISHRFIVASWEPASCAYCDKGNGSGHIPIRSIIPL